MAYSKHASTYPLPCSECGQDQVYIDHIEYDAEIKHDGKLHTFHIPRLTVNKCKCCGEVYFDAVTSDEISQALRGHLNLLSPLDIRVGIVSRGLNQKQFGETIGVAPETVSRWLSGSHIQSRAMDNLMRMFFAFGSPRSVVHSRLGSNDLCSSHFAAFVSKNPDTGAVTLDHIVEQVPQSLARWNTQCPEFDAAMSTEIYPTADPTESNLALAV